MFFLSDISYQSFSLAVARIIVRIVERHLEISPFIRAILLFKEYYNMNPQVGFPRKEECIKKI